MKKVLFGVLFAILLFSVFASSFMTHLGKAQFADCLIISSNDMLGFLDGFQPVQVVWQMDYEHGTLGDMVFKSYGQPDGTDVEWEACLPMVLGKNTFLFGTLNREMIRFRVRNYYVHGIFGLKIFRLKFKILPDGLEFTTGLYAVMGGFQEPPGETIFPSETIVEIPAPFPSFFFRFQKADATQIEVTLMEVPEAGGFGKFVALNKFIVHETVKDTMGLGALYVPMRLKGHQFITYDKFYQMATESIKFIQGTYPLDENEFVAMPCYGYYHPSLSSEVTFGDPPKDGLELVLQMINMFDRLGVIAITTKADRAVGVLPKDWFKTYWGPINAMFEKTTGICGAALGYRRGVLVEEGSPMGSAHEIGHTYNLPLASHGVMEEYDGGPGEPASGYWVNEGLPMDDKICFMGKDRSTYKDIGNWIDKLCFRHLLMREFSGDPEILFVRGLIFKNSTASFREALYRLPYGTSDISIGAGGNYSVVLLDEVGGIIAQAGFNVTFTVLADVPIEVDVAPLGLSVPWINGTRQVQIRNATHVLTSKNVSLNSPTVTVTFPNGGEILELNANYTMTWEAIDPDGDQLTYSILYSNDNGSTWLPLATDLHETSFETSFNWNIAHFIGGSNNLIKIIANDGVNTGEDVSDGTFTLKIVRNINTGLDYATVQEAIDALETLDGHTVKVGGGPYYEHVVVNKALSLIGENRSTTIIDGSGSGYIINITANRVRISGFTVQNSGTVLYQSAGIALIGSSSNNIVSDNIVKNGIVGIAVSSGCNNSISGNIVTNHTGWGIVSSSNNSSISGNTITDNLVGIHLTYCSNTAIRGNTAINNTYGIYPYYCSNNNIYHNNFINNTWQVYNDASYNTWDNGYPSGGNHWSNYTGVDNFSGPYQNETGSDGIGDTPYIDERYTPIRDNYPLKQPYVAIHDITSANVTTYKTIVGQSFTLSINALVTNRGEFTETIRITICANITAIATQTVTLTSGGSATVTFTWNTSGFAKGNYTISAYATPVPGETETADNKYIGGMVRIGVPGDLNGDGKCNLSDLVKVAGKFGKSLGDPGYDPNYDMNNDNKINLSDLVRVAMHFGTTDP